MPGQRIQRVNELLRHEIAAGLYRVQTAPPLDLARVTVSGVDTTPDLQKATVHVSVLPAPDGADDTDHILRTLNRARKDFQRLVADHIVLKYTPHLQFVKDEGQAHADRIYRILDNLPPMADESTPGEETPDGPPA